MAGGRRKVVLLIAVRGMEREMKVSAAVEREEISEAVKGWIHRSG